MEIIKNAIIESVSIDTGDRDLLTVWLHLDYGRTAQGFGGFALYLPKSYTHFTENGDFAGHFIFRCMEVAGVQKWDDIVDKAIRVKLDNDTLSGRIIAIGHIVKDDWFNPEEDFKRMK